MPQTEMKKDAGVRWTEEQQRVIDARDKSLLVSAAAGSGKTAVLVERIMSLITDPVNPVDVDGILVVTFTNAAAAEMRERIRGALERAAREHPDDPGLQRQLSLIHNAQIMTIDSFCLQIVRNHFHRISLEPGFRVADTGELLLLKEDACSAVLEEFYEERDPEFLRFMQGYSNAKNDRKVRESILKFYDYAQSYPWPEEWIDNCAAQYDVSSVEEMEQKDWWASYSSHMRASAEEAAEVCSRCLALARDEDGPHSYIPVLEEELDLSERLLRCNGLREWKSAVEKFDFKSFNRGKKSHSDPEKSKLISSLRQDVVKKNINNLKEELAADPEEQVEILRKAGEMVRVLVKLTKAFSERFAAEKAERNILDFSDGEHFALRILVDPVTRQPTGTADEYRRRFREVMVDEYQDSNHLQEAILTAVSGIPDGRQNMFMVGDVKQSIYRFRRACPDLFIDKYDRFSTDENPTQRIDLHRNFRSRGEVINIVNDLFGRIMGKDLGNVEYDEDASLFQGRKCDDGEKTDYRPERIIVKRERGRDIALDEAGVIARRIRKMVEEEEIPGISYRDIVVLVRSTTRSQSFVKAFEAEGVPLLVTSQTGYFNANEVQVVMSMLRVIDNPLQDIPLASLMRSPIGGFSDREMAEIRTVDPDIPFYECVMRSAENEKVSRLLRLIDDFRERMPYTPIHVLIRQIYDETGYRDIAMALPAGEQRRANLDMLIEKAAAYENTSYHGLYHFVRYVDRLIKYEADIGEAEVSSEQEDTVRLITIHKSKGLEFPVVFVAGMGKEINLNDAKEEMIFHPDHGVGIKYCDPDLRSKTDTLIRKAFSFETKKESLGEELRVLYVAMTRAKDKLILVGQEPKKEKAVEWPEEPYGKLTFATRYGAETYWDWVLPALSGFGETYPVKSEGPKEEETQDVMHIAGTAKRKAALLRELETADEEILNGLSESFSWEYPYRQSGLRQKMSVSEIKHRAMEESEKMSDEEQPRELFPEKPPEACIPKFVKEPEENAGALRGTAFHRLMECLDFSALSGEEGVWLESETARLCGNGRLEEADAERIDPEQVLCFLRTELAERMAAAAKKGLLVREQPFVMSVPAGSLPADMAADEADAEEPVLIQGIIDAFWEEDDGIVLLDYKTDRVKTADELIRRYRVQIILYAEALGRRFTGKRVKEALIYSSCLDEVISVDVGE